MDGNPMVAAMLCDGFRSVAGVAAGAIVNSAGRAPRLFVMNFLMPAIGGLELADKLRRREGATGLSVVLVAARAGIGERPAAGDRLADGLGPADKARPGPDGETEEEDVLLDS